MDYHSADMVKWLSSEVSNLMSWVRLPLSAPPSQFREGRQKPPARVTMKGSPSEPASNTSVMMHGFPFALFAHALALPAWLLGQHLRHDVGQMVTQDRVWALAHRRRSRHGRREPNVGGWKNMEWTDRRFTHLRIVVHAPGLVGEHRRHDHRI